LNDLFWGFESMSSPLQAGQRFGKYEIVQLIGRGGMADVYEAMDTVLLRRVALKILPPEFSRDEERAARFIKEVRTAAALQHPGIITIYEVDKLDMSNYFSMALLTGGDLKQKIRGGIKPDDAIEITTKIANALDHAHRKGLIHRDIKPENIVFNADGEPVVADFGIAKATAGGTQMTAMGMLIGTPRYMSPEQARGEAELDGRSDFYSLGVVLYEMLTGNVPYDAQTTMAILLKHIQDPPPVLPEALSKYQPFLDKFLSKEPSDRFANSQEVAAAARQFKTSTGKIAAPVLLRPKSEGGPDGQFTTRRRTVEAAAPSMEEQLARIEPVARAPAAETKRGLPIVPIAIGVAVLLGAGAWFFLSGSKDEVAPAVTTTVPAAPPTAAPAATDPAAAPVDPVAAASPDAPAATTPTTDIDSELMASPALMREKRIIELAQAAEAHFRAGRYTAPAGSNALESWRALLGVDPASAEARAGIAKLIQTLMASVTRALAAKDVPAAETAIAQIRAVDSQAAGLREFEAAVAAAKKEAEAPAVVAAPAATPAAAATTPAPRPAANTPAATPPPTAAAQPRPDAARPATPAATPAASGPTTPVAVLRRVDPDYPRDAFRKQTEGRVQVSFLVTVEGRVSEARVVSAQPPRIFDQAALRAIQQWTFRPAVENGKPVAKRAEQVFEFSLD
jgi:TonB family protein